MEGSGKLGQVDGGTTERQPIPIRLLIDDLGLPPRHRPPVLLGDGGVVLPALALFLLLLIAL
jgi:hypothetical protein